MINITNHQKKKVVEYKNSLVRNPLVSVIVVTYQQALYINQCLDSILAQESNFDFEILVGEDASTDGTREICLDYAKKYPNRIRLFLHSRENVIYINGTPTGRYNMLYNLNAAKGKYVAFCEGDDYWTDPMKLQKQVDFLEANPDYGLIHSDYDEYFQKDGKLLSSRHRRTNRSNSKNVKDIYIAQLNHDSYHVRTATVCANRQLILKAINNNFDLMTQISALGDYPLFLELSRLTKFKYLDESMAVHRILPESASKTKNYKKKKAFLKSSYTIQKYFSNKYPCPPEIENQIHEKAGLIFLELAARNMDRKLAEEAKGILNKTSLKINLLYLASYKKPINLVYFYFYSSIFGKGTRLIHRKLAFK